MSLRDMEEMAKGVTLVPLNHKISPDYAWVVEIFRQSTSLHFFQSVFSCVRLRPVS